VEFKVNAARGHPTLETANRAVRVGGPMVPKVKEQELEHATFKYGILWSGAGGHHRTDMALYRNSAGWLQSQ
jgi:hypothetical protein